MAYVILTGLPENSVLTKVVFLLKSIFKKGGSMKFWIKEMSDIRGANIKTAKIELYNLQDAHKAVELLDGYVLNNRPLSAKFDESEYGGSVRYKQNVYDDRRHYSRHERRYSRERQRSRSPYYERETSELDLEIELLRKKRMIIEEERRLLLESKKLQMAREYGPGASKEFGYVEHRDARDKHFRGNRQAYRQQERSPQPWERHNSRRPRYAPSPYKKPFPKQEILPNFYVPVRLILGEMADILKEKEVTDNNLFLEVARSNIRKRMAILLEGKPRLTGQKILALYRAVHPKSLDEAFVEKLMSDVKACELVSTRKSRKRNRAKEEHRSLKDGTSAEESDTNKITNEEIESRIQQIKDEILKKKGDNEKVTTEHAPSTVTGKKAKLKATNELDKPISERKKEHNSEIRVEPSSEQKDKLSAEQKDASSSDHNEELVSGHVVETGSEHVDPNAKDQEELDISIDEDKTDISSTDKKLELALSLDPTEIALALNENDNENKWVEDRNENVPDSEEAKEV